MESSRTLAIIKPDAVSNSSVGDMIHRIEVERLRIVAMKMVHLGAPEAEKFYHVHANRPFFRNLIDFMTSGPVVIMVLEGEEAVGKWRAIMGATDPAQAEAGTLRRLYGTNKEKNACHGSDSKASADFEIDCFFKESELLQIDPHRVMTSGSAGD